MLIGIGFFIVGFILVSLATISFKLRAITNKPAWGGITLPSGLIGGIALVIGVIIIALLMR
ncbi:hypothetical protein [Levilactobacillus spicheri]|uniref:Uncharacterized protein n=2 Tax=Levilactobacillus spicheri TaxID=216463 RepID=A0A0F3RVL3_9LACO|nr:hypothetical protein [Levilactobacillus spicheri]KJW13644.1 hypothetical protein VC81_01740 [Levilactobacillus spicheri]KRL48537.1 hypothetical protein FD37_GL000994 [Levilactobacillus spicheri DSM 15429]GEO67741.1 hypothetical protein LSP04_21600 [Levilactobacillus spicheri]